MSHTINWADEIRKCVVARVRRARAASPLECVCMCVCVRMREREIESALNKPLRLVFLSATVTISDLRLAWWRRQMQSHKSMMNREAVYTEKATKKRRNTRNMPSSLQVTCVNDRRWVQFGDSFSQPAEMRMVEHRSVFVDANNQLFCLSGAMPCELTIFEIAKNKTKNKIK